MRGYLYITIAAIGLCGFTGSESSAPISPDGENAIDRYFEQYCSRGNHANFPPSASMHYGDAFRARLKKTNDPELRRLFVLKNLYDDIDSKISELERGLIWPGRAEERPMNGVERMELKQTIIKLLRDLEKFDHEDPYKELSKFRERMRKATGTKL